MKVLKRFKSTLLEADMFYSSNILKYNSETHYKTFLGAILSMIIITSIVVGFSK
jgi:hypothetical protein